MYENMTYVKTFCEQNMPLIKVYIPQGTTLLWIDFGGFMEDSD